MLLSELDGMAYLCHVDEYWTMEYVSDGCLTLTGYLPEDLTQNNRITFMQITHPDDREKVWTDINLSINANQAFSIVYRIIHADGSIRWVLERGRSIFQPESKQKLIHGFIEDITERHFHEKALIEAEQRYRSIFENAIEGIFQTSTNGGYIRVNKSLARIYGYTSPEDMIKSLQNIKQQLYCIPQRRDDFISLIKESGIVKNFESEVYRSDGSIIWISENAYEVHDADGKLIYYEGTVEDISERKKYESIITHQATHDTLTDLPNRTLLMDRIEQVMHRAHRTNSRAAVVFLDLDHFKNVNDSFGHAFGDKLIQTVAERLQLNLREVDTAARLGGDEFVVLLADIHQDSEKVSHIIERILATIEEPCLINGHNYLISCSIGISLYPEDGNTAETLLINADAAMYRSKQIGRNTYQFFTADLNSKVADRIYLEQKLRIAINENQFELYYQPKFDTETQMLIGSEALIRWNIPGEKKPLSPLEFIPLAESSGLIIPLGQWVINEACRQLREWIDGGFVVHPVSINLSAIQLQKLDLVEKINQALLQHQIAPELLVVEITESCFAIEESVLLENLNQLAEIGVVIAIDDFGTGYSNMHSLKSMPLKYIKIDRSFISGVENDHRDRAIYRAIVAMAKNLGLRVVAEGVETKAQFDFLISIGCDEVQGYYFYRPLLVSRFEEIMVSYLSPNRLLKKISKGYLGSV